jgi:uncharacterized protein DUF4838
MKKNQLKNQTINSFPFKLLLLLILLVFGSHAWCVPETKLKEFSRIVYTSDGNIWNKIAAKELQRRIKQLTGKTAIIETATPANSQGTIFIGSSAIKQHLIGEKEFKALPMDGYCAVLKDGVGGICGDRVASGALYGIYAFLGQFGLNIYATDCEILPKNPKAADFKLTAHPAAGIRMMSCIFREHVDMDGWGIAKLGFSYRKRYKIINEDVVLQKSDQMISVIGGRSHATWSIFPKKLADSHPEYFARDRQGKVKSSRWHLCLSNPKVREESYKIIKKWAGERPERVFIKFGAGDDEDWCECDACLKLDPGPWKVDSKRNNMPYNMTDRLLNYLNELADKLKRDYPNKYLRMSLYQSTETPPLKTNRISDNIYPTFAPYPIGGCSCHGHDFNCPHNAEFKRNFFAWKKKFPELKFMGFDYPMNYRSRWTALYFNDAMIARTRFFLKHGCIAIEFCGTSYVFHDLFTYLMGKLLWNSKLTDKQLAALEDDFLKHYYGAAADDMKQILTLIRKRSKQVCQGIYSKSSPILNEEYCKQAYAIFNRAASKVADKQTLLFRVLREEVTTVLFSDLNEYVTKSDGTRLKLLKKFIGILELYYKHIDPKFLRRRLPVAANFIRGGDMKNWVHDKFGINISTRKGRFWFDAPELAKLKRCSTDAEFAALAKQYTQNKSLESFVLTTSKAISMGINCFHIKGAWLKKSYKRFDSEKSGTAIAAIYGGESMRAIFPYAGKQPLTSGKLTLYGKDNDKSTVTILRISINGKEIFNGPNNAAKNKIVPIEFAIPDGLVKNGKNELLIEDISKPKPHANWFILQRAVITPSNYPWKQLNLPRTKVCFYPPSSVRSEMDKLQITPTGKIAEKLTLRKGELKFSSKIQVYWMQNSAHFKKGKTYRIEFWIKGNINTQIVPFCMVHKAPFKAMGKSAKSRKVVLLGKEWQKVVITFKLLNEGPGYRIPGMFLGKQKKGTSIWISPIKVFEKSE